MRWGFSASCPKGRHLRRNPRPDSARLSRRHSNGGADPGRRMMARNLKPLIFAGIAAGLIILPSVVHAAPSGLDALIATPDGRGSVSYTVPVQILLFMTGLV